MDVNTIINSCEWDSTFLLFISKNVFDPFIYYSHLLPLILSLSAGLFVLIKGWRELAARVLAFITLAFSLWTFFDLIVWATDKPWLTMFFWSTTNMLEVIIYAATVYFTQIFIGKSDTGLKSKLIMFALILPVILFTPTAYSLIGYDLTNCNRDAIEGPLAHYGYIIEIVFILWIVLLGMEKSRGAQHEERKRIALTIIGSIAFLLVFSWGNIVGSLSDDWRISQWGLFGMPLFIFFLGYLVVKFKAFRIKAIATDALVATLWFLIGSVLFIAKSTPTKIIVAVTEIIAIIFGIMLIRSVRREVMQREQLEKLTRELAEKNVKLEELDKVKSQFLSFASHDLKSPMNIIKQFASLILDKTYAAPEKIMEAVTKIKLNAERGISLVEDFLDFRKIEEGKMAYTLEKKNLVELVRGLTEDFKVMAHEQKNILVTFASKRQEIPVMVDVTRFNQVIQNLLSNSLKYTEKGSIHVTISEEQHTALITVSDTGIGIKPDVLPTLFEQFHRDPGVAKKINGTGLGLYIAKQIILGHGGEIWAHSEGLGLGSTFSVRMKKAE